MTGKLNLDPALVARARELARLAGQPVTDLARTHTTVSVERAVLRLAGLDGADEDGMPWVNRLTDAVRESVGLEHGVALPAWDALLTGGLSRPAHAGCRRGQRPGQVPPAHGGRRRRGPRIGRPFGTKRPRPDRCPARRTGPMIAATSDPPMPWIYLIVATGDIYEDIPQAQAAAREGADVIAVIRSTGQSLLDYVPEGATREGYAGTYATRENFRLMRGALDDVSRELGRYVRLTNYASGLCMPEIAALAGLERLDMMLNDCMYGIIFRDINPVRTFIDQRFSRQVHARAGIVINTGEDNYLTTADAVDAAHTVVVSQLLNEYFGREAGPGRRPARARPRVRDQPGGARFLPARAGARPADQGAVPGRAAEVHAADQAHDRQRVRRLPAGRVLQPGRGDDRSVHPAHRHDDRGHPHAVPVRPRPGPGERPVRSPRRRAARRVVPARTGRVRRPARPAGARRGHRPAAPGSARRGC